MAKQAPSSFCKLDIIMFKKACVSCQWLAASFTLARCVCAFTGHIKNSCQDGWHVQHAVIEWHGVTKSTLARAAGVSLENDVSPLVRVLDLYIYLFFLYEWLCSCSDRTGFADKAQRTSVAWQRYTVKSRRLCLAMKQFCISQKTCTHTHTHTTLDVLEQLPVVVLCRSACTHHAQFCLRMDSISVYGWHYAMRFFFVALRRHTYLRKHTNTLNFHLGFLSAVEPVIESQSLWNDSKVWGKSGKCTSL